MSKRDPVIVEVKAVVTPLPTTAVVPANPRAAIITGLLIMVLGVGGFFYWAYTAKLDEGVPVQGSVIVDSKKKTIQHPTGGVVSKIMVRDGDHVKKDDVLLQLTNTQSEASVEINRNQVQSTKNQIAFLNEQIALIEQQLSELKPLIDQGYYPKNQYQDRERQLLEFKRQRSEQSHLRDDAESRIKVAHEEQKRTEIRSPVDGIVMMQTINTVGGVVQPGARLMDIEPDNEKLVLEVQIPTHLIDKIQAGLVAEVRMSALNQRTTPVLEGKVLWVSPDRIQDPQRPEIAYFNARVEITPDSLSKLKDEKIQPGMPAEVILKTGSRTFWDYLVKPIEDRAALSLKER